MGAAILLIYVPTLLVTAIVSNFIGKYISRKIRRTETEETLKALAKTRKKAYIIGAATSILITITSAWWYASTTPGLNAAFISITISLFTPSIIGLLILLAAFILRKFGMKRKSYALFYTASSAFQTTIAIPIAIYFSYSFLSTLYDFIFPVLFKMHCKNANIEIMKSTRPPKGFALIPKSRSPQRYREKNPEQLLLSRNTPLQFIETVDNPSSPDEEFIRLTKKVPREQDNHEKNEELFSRERITSLNAEYYVKFTEIKVSQFFNFEGDIKGQTIQIERASDNKIIASAKGYWRENGSLECPKNFGDTDFMIKFIAETFNLPLH